MNRTTLIKPFIAQKSPYKILYGFISTTQYDEIFLGYYLEENLYICYVHFKSNKTLDYFKNDLQKLWPNSILEYDDKLTEDVFKTQQFYVVLNGTDFQKKVWSALLDIPFGAQRTYADIAVAIGNPKAVRAVASAIGSNNIAIFIPCHRVKAKTGDVHKYRWGSDLKKKLLLNEQANKCAIVLKRTKYIYK